MTTPTTESSGLENHPADEKETKANNADIENDKRVSYASHVKLLAEKKKIQEKLEALESLAKEKDDETLLKAGKFEEIAKKQAEEIKRVKELNLNLKKGFAEKALFNSFATIAREKGCVSPEKLLRLADAESLKNISVDLDTFEVGADSLVELIDHLAKENDFLFNKRTVNQPPKPFEGASVQSQKLDISKFKSGAQLMEYLKKNGLKT